MIVESSVLKQYLFVGVKTFLFPVKDCNFNFFNVDSCICVWMDVMQLGLSYCLVAVLHLEVMQL